MQAEEEEMDLDSSMDPIEEQEDMQWIFSYADLMSFLLAFFIILFSISDLNEEKLDELGQSISESFNENADKSDAPKEKDSTDREANAFRSLVTIMNLGKSEEVMRKVEKASKAKSEESVIKKALREQMNLSGNIDLIKEGKDKEGFLQIILPNTFLFDTGSASVSTQAEKQLEILAKTLLPYDEKLKIEVIGHSDSRPVKYSKPFTDNFGLSAARAGKVAKQLVDFGISKEKLLVRGMADLDPILPEKDGRGNYITENLARNRRVQIIIRKKEL